jgi:D-threo-aldose 1-dehydrogenase
MLISTKVGRLVWPWPPRFGPRKNRGPTIDPLDFEVRFDYTYHGIIRSYEDSLQRLGLPEVDMLFVHDLDRQFHATETTFNARFNQLVATSWWPAALMHCEICAPAARSGPLAPAPTM